MCNFNWNQNDIKIICVIWRQTLSNTNRHNNKQVIDIRDYSLQFRKLNIDIFES